MIISPQIVLSRTSSRIAKLLHPTRSQHVLSLIKPSSRTRYFSLNSKWQAVVEDQPTSTLPASEAPSSEQETSKRKKTESSTNSRLYNNGKLALDPIYLRDSCRCHQCIDPSDKQRNFQYSDIPQDIAVAKFEENVDGSYQITWENDIPGFKDHVSIYKPGLIRNMLRRNGSHGVFQRPYKKGRVLWDRTAFENAARKIEFTDFMANGPAFNDAVLQLWQYGLLMLKNVPEKESAVQEVAERMGPLYNTFYGSTWDVKSVPAAKNVAYTSKHLGFHMDLLYMKEPPGVQLLHCLHNSCQGGESRFVDTLKAIDILIEEDPKSFHTLFEHHLEYAYANDGFFYTDMKPIFERAAGHECFSVYGAKQLKATHRIGNVYWSPQFLRSIRSIHKPADQQEAKRFLSASKRFADILERPELVHETKMNPGECSIFSNLRVVHARNAFDVNSGKRWLRGAYIRGQDLLNKVTWILDQQSDKKKIDKRDIRFAKTDSHSESARTTSSAM